VREEVFAHFENFTPGCGFAQRAFGEPLLAFLIPQGYDFDIHPRGPFTKRNSTGAEDDGQDETLCLWDGQCTDDYLRSLWEEIPGGVRVLYVTDTCNSGTNYKGGPRSVRRSLPRGYKGAMIHFGGCADGESSYGSEQGGSWTTALIDGWSGTATYRGWFDGAAAAMPAGQVPVYAEYGGVTEGFRGGPALR